MKYKEQTQLVSDLRALADFVERPESIELPTIDLRTIQTWISVYGYVDDIFQQDSLAVKSKMKRIAKALGSCKKEYDSHGFELVKEFGNIKLTFRTSRESICKAVPTGEKRIVPSVYLPEREEEVIEWVCDDPILAAN